MTMTMKFVYHNKEYYLPVNPEEVTISQKNSNETQKVVSFGEVSLLGTPQLREFQIKSFFSDPKRPALCSGYRIQIPSSPRLYRPV